MSPGARLLGWLLGSPGWWHAITAAHTPDAAWRNVRCCWQGVAACHTLGARALPGWAHLLLLLSLLFSCFEKSLELFFLLFTVPDTLNTMT